MPFNAVVFDFDGCLVDSTQVKHDAFFDIFPGGEAHRRVVSEVLRTDPDGSRYSVIPRMADRMRRAGLSLDDHLSDEERVAAYGVAVHEAVAAAPTLPRAEETLRRARQARSVYISSNTPVASLNELVRRRGWLPLVDAVYGYPRRKVDTVRQIVADDCGGRGDLVLVVGDGMSDEAAARENGCVFVAVDARVGLTPVLNLLEASDVPG